MDLNLPLTLAPGQSSPSFNVVFAPQSAGAASGTLSLTSNASNPTLNIPLSGTGVTGGTLAANPSSLNFGNVQTGNNQTLAETVTNSGGSSVTITQAAVTGSGFTVNGLNLPLTLAPGQSSPSFNVVFAPQSAGAASGSFPSPAMRLTQRSTFLCRAPGLHQEASPQIRPASASATCRSATIRPYRKQ